MPAEDSNTPESPTRPELADRRGLATVYQPAEDSKLLADAAVDGVRRTDRVLDVGTGSGYIADRIATETGATVVGIDCNPHACRQARSAGVAVAMGDLLTPFRAGAFDVVSCNPPYLPTAPDAEWDDPMEAALSGGPTGRHVIDRFLADVDRVLAPDGSALLVVSSLAGIDEVRGDAAELGLDSTIVRSESYPFERLVVLSLDPSPAVV